MADLSHREMGGLLASISGLNSGSEPETLPNRTISAVSGLISSDIVSFDAFSISTDFLVKENWHNPPQTLPEHLLEILAEHFAEHPFLEHIQHRRSGAIRISDCVPVKEFHEKIVFNEFYKKVDVTHQMSVILPVTNQGVMTCTLNRDGMDFNDNERLLLTLMAPHLTTAIRNTSLLERFDRRHKSLNSALRTNGQAIITVKSNGTISVSSEYAYELLGKYFPQRKAKSLPDVVSDWLKPNLISDRFGNYAPPPGPFVVRNLSGKLTIRALDASSSEGVALLLEEQPEFSSLKNLPITKREEDILSWVATGKTNAEIGEICSISPRTVQKHVENICDKLGAENRTAAAMRAAEFIC